MDKLRDLVSGSPARSVTIVCAVQGGGVHIG